MSQFIEKEAGRNIGNPIKVKADGRGPQKTTPEKAQQRKIERTVARMDQKAIELLANPFSPEAVTAFNKAFWSVPRGKEGFTFEIGKVNATEERFRKPIKDVKGNEIIPFTLGIPQELKGRQGLIKLGLMFPEIGSYSVAQDTSIKDESDKTGYVKIEGVLDAPNLDTDEKQAKKHFENQGISGQRLLTYLIFSRQMKILQGQYPDINTWSRLPGSSDDGRVVDAYCLSYGHVDVSRDLAPSDRRPLLGFRSEEVL